MNHLYSAAATLDAKVLRGACHEINAHNLGGRGSLDENWAPLSPGGRLRAERAQGDWPQRVAGWTTRMAERAWSWSELPMHPTVQPALGRSCPTPTPGRAVMRECLPAEDGQVFAGEP
jgi:hypothetical protein